MTQEINATIRGKQSNVPYEKKTVVLGGNMVGERNILTQDMLLSEDTKYIIRWAFDLDAKTVIMPAGSLLEFNGGSINNGTIVLNDTPVYPSYNMLTSGSHLTVEGNPSTGTYNYVNGMPVWWNGSAWVDAKGYPMARTVGWTKNRPLGKPASGGILTSEGEGFEYYDLSLHKKIYVRSVNSTTGDIKWVEADGAVAGVKRNGTFAEKPSASDIYVGFHYFCTDKQTAEGATNGIEIIHKGNDVWVDALGRIIS